MPFPTAALLRQQADAGGVAGAGGEEVGDDVGAEGGVRGERGEEEVVEERGEEGGGAELVGEVEREGYLSPFTTTNNDL